MKEWVPTDIFKTIAKEEGFYSQLNGLTPFQVHGYKITEETCHVLLTEIDYEISVQPTHMDILLDVRNYVNEQLKNIKNDKGRTNTKAC